MPVDPSLRGQIRAKILADYGESTMLPGNKMPKPRRLPLDDLALEYVSGGGLPFAHMSRFWGAPSSGKTHALMKAFYAAQNFGKIRHRQLMGLAELSFAAEESRQAKLLKDQAKREQELDKLACLFVLAEKTFDERVPLKLGVDLSDLEIVPNTRIEVIGDIVQKALGAYHVIGVDSTSASISIDELGHKEGIYNEIQLKRVMRWGINMDWWRDRMSPDNCVIFTSHSRETMGSRKSISAQAAEHAPGGFKLNFEPGLILHFMKGGGLKRKPNGGLEEIDADSARGGATSSAFGKFQAAGGVLVARCEKNKVGIAGRSVLLHHDKVANDFDALHEYEKFAAYYRVVAKSGSWWELPPGIMTPDGKTKTQQLRSTLAANPDLRARIESVVLRCAEDPVFESELLAGRTGELVEIPAVSS
jgi:RecA/RadA recombinase